MPKMIANYTNSFGKSQLQSSGQVKTPQKIRLVRNGQVLGERCRSCTGLEIKNRKVQPRMLEKFQHRKGCKYAV